MATNNSLNNTSSSHLFSSDTFIPGYTTTATAAGTTTLTVSSNELQYFTGTTTQTVLLPVVSTLVLGQSFTIVNNSTGVVTVESSGANSIKAMAAGSQLVVTCILITGTGTASWSSDYALLNGATVNISGGSTSQLVYQSAANTTTFLSTANTKISTTGLLSTAPTWSTQMGSSMIPVDGTTIAISPYYSETLVNITTTTSGMTNTQCITFNIAGTQYVAAGNASASTMTIYTWTGSTFSLIQTISSLTTCTGLAYFVISSVSYLTCTSGSNIATFSWNGSSFVSVGSTVATGATPSFMVYYIISGTSYLSVTNLGSSSFSNYSWSGSNWSSLGSAITTASSPYGIVYYVISGTSYLSVVEVGGNSFSTWSWNGTTWVSTGNTQGFTGGSSTLFISYFVSQGIPYMTAAYQSLNQLQMWKFSGGVWSGYGSAISTPSSSAPTWMYVYTLSGQTFMIISYQGTNQLQIWRWNNSTLVTYGSTVATGTQPKAGQTFILQNLMYYVVGNRGTNTFSSYYLPNAPIALTGTLNGGIKTAPVSSHTATAAFGSTINTGTNYQNTTGYDILCTICFPVTAATTGTFNIGVGPTSNPTVDQVISVGNVSTTKIFNCAAIVPNNYYVYINGGGSITGSIPTCVVFPL